jgi:hypothetical protein
VLFAATEIGVSGAVLTLAPDLYIALAQAAPWAWHQEIGLAVVEPAPRLFGARPALAGSRG